MNNQDPFDSHLGDTDSALLDEIVEDFTQKLREGKHPPIDEYQKKHPELSGSIAEVLASVAMIEKLKTAANATPSPNQKTLNEVSKLAAVANYTIIREVGRGGMGVVFEAVHQSLGRRVAIKVMPTPIVDSEKYIQRFKREAKAAAKLHHTNIVGVFEVGEGDRYHYYVMDFVDGNGLNEIIRTFKKQQEISQGTVSFAAVDHEDLEPDGEDLAREFECQDPMSDAMDLESPESPSFYRWAARVGANLADALAYAHNSKILHRDIKPSNMILDQNGTVWITDFGLAKEISEEINLTKTGDVIGTPQYLAPESLEGVYDQRSEVYCLGLTLYELVTLAPAYKPGSTAEVLRSIHWDRPSSPRKLNRKVPLDLSEIIDKAIERSPDKRYQSADEMKNDLIAFMEDRPVAARPPSATGMILRWWRRRPLESSLSFAAVVVATIIPIFAMVAQWEASRKLNEENDKRMRLEVRTKEVERNRSIAEVEQQNAARAKQLADIYLNKMQAQNERADTNVSLTLQAFDDVYMQVLTKGAPVENQQELDTFQQILGLETAITAADTKIVEKLLQHYQKFVKLNADNQKLFRETARAFRRVANIHQLLGQYQPADEAYIESIEIYKNILNQEPNSAEIKIKLAQTLSEHYHNAARIGHRRRAQKLISQCQRLIESIVVDELDSKLRLDFVRTIASVCADRYDLTASSQQTEDFKVFAMEELERAIGILNQLISVPKMSLEARKVRASCLGSLAAALSGRSNSAAKFEAYFEKAVEELKWLIDVEPNNPSHQYRLALTYTIQSKLHSPSELEKRLQNAIRITEELVTRYPEVLDYHQFLAATEVRLSENQISSNNLAAALNSLEAAKGHLEYIASQSSIRAALYQLTQKAHSRCLELASLAAQNNASDIRVAARTLADSLQSKFQLVPTQLN
ncbi:MAG: serine/threonine-protein kinase [Planctomycetota bacterium]